MLNEQTQPMTAEEFISNNYSYSKEPLAWRLFKGSVASLMNDYANYRLEFDRQQREKVEQQSWMPTEEEWKQFPEAKWAALDLDGQRDMYRQEPERHDRFDVWDGDCIIDASKMMKPITDWFLAKCQRPEGI